MRYSQQIPTWKKREGNQSLGTFALIFISPQYSAVLYSIPQDSAVLCSTDRSKPLGEPLGADSWYLHLQRNPTGEPELNTGVLLMPFRARRAGGTPEMTFLRPIWVQRCSSEDVGKSFLVLSQHSKLLKGFGDEEKQR